MAAIYILSNQGSRYIGVTTIARDTLSKLHFGGELTHYIPVDQQTWKVSKLVEQFLSRFKTDERGWIQCSEEELAPLVLCENIVRSFQQGPLQEKSISSWPSIGEACKHLMKRGPRKGQPCGEPCVFLDYCDKHHREGHHKYCTHVLLKGVNKGKVCGKLARKDDRCFVHCKP